MSGGGSRRIEVGEAGSRVGLNVEVHGSGVPLLALHGFMGSAATWTPFAESWQEVQLVAVDLLGHGGSDAPVDAGRYRVERTVEDLVAVLDRLSLAPVVVLGYSMGGRVAMRLALHLAERAPDRLRGLILESASAGIADAGERAARVASDRALADRIERDGIEAFVREWESLPMWASQSGLSEAARSGLRAQRLGQLAVGLANSLRGMGAGVETPVLDDLSRLPTATLVVCGTMDAKYRAVGAAMGERIRASRVEIVEGCGHAVHLEAPDRFASLVGEFVASLPSN